MADDALISDLDAAATLSGSDLIEVEQGIDPTNNSGKATLQQVSDFCARTDFTNKTASGLIGAIDKETIELNVGSANTITIQPDATVDLGDGAIRNIIQTGTGQTTIVAGAGVTILTAAATLKLRARYSVATLIKRTANTWYVFGDLAAS
jgi:hypothetical protein